MRKYSKIIQRYGSCNPNLTRIVLAPRRTAWIGFAVPLAPSPTANT
ncbi:MAG: hypothetical protein ICV78_17415 [Tolypothrix sp. Co-bin9]|nr:hypothetical protein [Tolypothrix sp. Co-bin9]